MKKNIAEWMKRYSERVILSFSEDLKSWLDWGIIGCLMTGIYFIRPTAFLPIITALFCFCAIGGIVLTILLNLYRYARYGIVYQWNRRQVVRLVVLALTVSLVLWLGVPIIYSVEAQEKIIRIILIGGTLWSVSVMVFWIATDK